MKKIVLSLLTLAATMNIMAVNYSAKATITLESQDSYESCQIILGQSDELPAGLTNGEYAEINLDGRSVALYVELGGVKYQHLASNPATMTDLTLGAITDAATTYNLIISDVSGTETMKLKIGTEEIDVVAGTRTITLTPNQTSGVAIGVVNPSAPLVQGICFKYNKLELTKYDGATVEVFADGVATAAVTDVVAGDATYLVDLNAQASGKYKVVVTIPGVATPEEYIIDVKPAVTIVP